MRTPIFLYQSETKELPDMALPELPLKEIEKDSIDRTLDRILKKLDQEEQIGFADINQVIVAAQVQEGITRYRAQARDMTPRALREEEHNSAILGRHLEEKFGPRPLRCHAHAIIAGKHKYSAALRLIMARLKIRIDDVDNGCWLPENIAATPHPAFPKAPPHSRIHRFNYYFWIDSRLSAIRNEKLFRNNLKLISQMLYTGAMPQYVLLPRRTGLPDQRFA